MTSSWHRIGLLTDIPRRGARCVVTPLGRIAVFRTAEDRIFATEDRCPHKGGPLSEGIVHDSSVTCPLHNAVISLTSGEMRGPDEGRVRVFAVRVDPLTEVIELSLAEQVAELHEAAE
ncbi:nitrite reductase small subunit NirD [Aurantimonas sp. 22II-16-19i]|uniref:nitrite reductase small subunit NirD n=1 Tax=Aurantimonas sp. 22II-16-19i TaxID=1317114 RepID=UPI0009FACE70|nr:nitrite reductase small subunit NirD [Aurantimonas sp. 22II-16-19i]MBU1441801.1 nitrite reductase small subunit NirD [Gammaproteobacteria bacterium]